MFSPQSMTQVMNAEYYKQVVDAIKKRNGSGPVSLLTQEELDKLAFLDDPNSLEMRGYQAYLVNKAQKQAEQERQQQQSVRRMQMFAPNNAGPANEKTVLSVTPFVGHV